MKPEIRVKARVPIFFCTFCLVAVLTGAGLYADLQRGRYQAATLGQFSQAAPTAGVPDSQYGGAAYPLYPPQLEAGEGQAEVEGYCSMCHSTRYITMQPPLPAPAWEAEVTKMKKTFGATMPDAAASRIIQYLQAHYTPETRTQ